MVGGPNDWSKRIDEGLCALYPCPGRILLRNMETEKHPVPEWINEAAMKNGHDKNTELIETTTYIYRCMTCGNEVMSTRFLEAALKN
jgi:predicted SprT family Zn-dependent metalloprotease